MLALMLWGDENVYRKPLSKLLWRFVLGWKRGDDRLNLEDGGCNDILINIIIIINYLVLIYF